MLLKLKIVKIALHKLLMISIESEVDDGGELPEDFNDLSVELSITEID